MTELFNKTQGKQKRRELRRNMTKAELMIWSKLRRKQVCGYKFRRQYGVGSYIIDFYCPKIKLAVEIDGDRIFRKVSKRMISNGRHSLKASESAFYVSQIWKFMRIWLMFWKRLGE